MDLRLRFVFNSLGVRSEFTIVNPPTVPGQGEIMRFHWRDFLTDETDIEKIEEYEENGVFKANVFSRTYTKDYVTVMVSLFEEGHYTEEYGERSQRR